MPRVRGGIARRSGAWSLCLLAGLALSAAGADARPKCAGHSATIVGSQGRDVIKAPKKGRQSIVTLGGNDRVLSYRHTDWVCTGPGNDVVFAGTGRDFVRAGGGNDYVDGGRGKDKIYGGAGRDELQGNAGGDRMLGGSGVDRMYGELQDDRIFGQGQNDLIVGGQGIDRMRGNGGNDWLRGDTNRDAYYGQRGTDTASFATATPPGPADGRGGVNVDLRRGSAFGDEPAERLSGIENVVGSQFDDFIRGRHRGVVHGGIGPDTCTRFASADCEGSGTGVAIAYVNGLGSRDPGLVVMGAAESDSWRITATESSLYVSSERKLEARQGCAQLGNGVRCSRPAGLGYILAWGGGGDDAINADGDFPSSTLIKFDGGGDDDVLRGTKGNDILLAGQAGEDRLYGGAGSDALISRPGRDLLFGGKGSDQIATNDPCSGSVYSGGAGGGDVAGFAHMWRRGVAARLSGLAFARGLPRSKCTPSRVGHSNEILEGTRKNDILIGDRRANPLIIGREGNDIIRGLGGKDVLRGEAGRDSLYGDKGADVLEAVDRTRDRVLNCGKGGKVALRDHHDPRPEECGPHKRKRR